MKVVSVNVSPAKEVPYLGRTVTTGIFKTPVRGKVMVRRLNIDGDDQADRYMENNQAMGKLVVLVDSAEPVMHECEVL